MDSETAADAAIDAVRKLSSDIEIPTICEGLIEADLDQLASDAMSDACVPGNPRDASHEEVVDLFKKIMH